MVEFVLFAAALVVIVTVHVWTQIRAARAQRDLEQATAGMRDALYKQQKAIGRDAARVVAEHAVAAQAAHKAAEALVAESRDHAHLIRELAADPRIQRLLNERTVPGIPEGNG